MSICGSCNCLCGPFELCKKCKSFWVCRNNSICRQSEHFRTCVIVADREHRQQLRFKSGDKVICKVSVDGVIEWVDYTVVELWPNAHPNAAYLINRTSNNSPRTIDVDSNEFIRLKDFDITIPEQILLHHLKCGDVMEVLDKIVRKHKLNMTTIGPMLLHHSAIYGNLRNMITLSNKYNVSLQTPDAKGRNILHIALMSKQLRYSLDVRECFTGRHFTNRHLKYESLLFAVDNDQRTVLHHAVLLGDIHVLDGGLISHIVDYVKSDFSFFTQADQHGRTALDYAIAFKKQKLIDVLHTPTLNGKVQTFTNRKKESDEEGAGKAYINSLKSYFDVKGLTTENVVLAQCHADFFNDNMERAVASGWLDLTSWMIDGCWHMDQRWPRGSEAYVLNTIDILLKGSVAERSNKDVLKPQEYLNKLHLAFYDICRKWNPSSTPIRAFLMTYWSPGMNGMEGSFKVQVNDAWLLKRNGSYEFQTYLMHMSENLRGSLISQRADILRYLVSKLPEERRRHVPLQWFVIHKQLQLMDIYEMDYRPDFTLPLNQNPDLFTYSQTLKWMHKDVVAERRLSVGEFLLLLSVAVDYLPIFDALRGRVSPVTIHGMNLLQFAISQGSYLVVKECMKKGHFKQSDIVANGINALHIAVRNNHAHVAEYIRKCLDHKSIADVLPEYYRMTSSPVLCQEWRNGVIKLQRQVRRFQVHKKYPFNFAAWKRFNTCWGPVSRALHKERYFKEADNWVTIKLMYDIVSSELNVDDDISQLTSSVMLLSEGEPHTMLIGADESAAPDITVDETECVPQTPLEHIELSQHVVKWFGGAQSVFREMFLKRLQQLADGQRSYALSKRLQGCKYPMFETKLESGMRILWTKLQRENHVESIMIWFVSKHDRVSRYLELIDASCHRLSRELICTQHSERVEASVLLGDGDVLIDPAGNCPLKVYQLSRSQVGMVSTESEWRPPLRLSKKQQQVNDESGTVLLLGRSGTGKTICLSDRMIRDRASGAVSQLFVCRSKRLCEFVQGHQVQNSDTASLLNSQFMTLSVFAAQIAALIASDHGPGARLFSAAQRVSYFRFVGSILPDIRKKCRVDGAVIWLHIRSFIKGSVEAVVQKVPLTLEQYIDLNVFGADRCRLSLVDRKEVYALYLRYEDVLKTQGLWDDADYTLDLLTRSKLEPLSTQYDKVYVDEVQDNTQAEIVLYFLASGMNTQSLFLAGDPAQSVVEGVDFRFEDVRGIVYKLSGGKYGINRPMKLFTNYRSHSGILNCAAAVLDKMFVMFPGAANVLPKDVGLFKGPRPACCPLDGMEGLVKLLAKNERLILLCADEDVERVESLLVTAGTKNVVMGIRAAKGLEFQDVVLLDFFGHISKDDQSVWKALLDGDSLSSTPHAHVELQLKLLYTAITRSCNRLIFVETAASKLSSVFFRWLVGASLAEMYNPTNEAEVLMTSDEWRAQGIEFALSAEGDSTVSFLQKAVKCFCHAGPTSSKILTRATAQLNIAIVTSDICSHSGLLTAVGEQRAAEAVLGGLRAGLLTTTWDLCEVLHDRIACSNVFDERVRNVVVRCKDHK